MKNEMKGIVVSWELEDIIPWKIDKAHAFLPFFVIVRNLLSIISGDDYYRLVSGRRRL